MDRQRDPKRLFPVQGQLDRVYSHWRCRCVLAQPVGADGVVGGQEPIEYPTLFQTIDDGPPKQTFFNIPRNTSMVMINGTVGPTYTSLLDFSLSPPPPGDTDFYHNVGMNNAWTAPAATLYLAALDPTIEYSFTISRSLIDTWNASNPNDVGLHSVTFYNALS